MPSEIATEHPHVIRQPGVCGGAPLIRGTRITVRHVAALWKKGDSVEDIVQCYPHLRPSWVHDALSYYLDHQQEIDQEIEANRIENVLNRHDATMDPNGVIHFPKGERQDGQ